MPQKNPLWVLLHQVLEFHSEPQTTRDKKSSPPLEGPQIIPPTTATEPQTKSASSPRVFSTTVFPPAFGPVRRRHWLLVPNLTPPKYDENDGTSQSSGRILAWAPHSNRYPTTFNIGHQLAPPKKKTQGTSKLHSAARISLTFFPPRSIRHGLRAWTQKSFRVNSKVTWNLPVFHACLHWMIPSSPTLGTWWNRWNRWMTVKVALLTESFGGTAPASPSMSSPKKRRARAKSMRAAASTGPRYFTLKLKSIPSRELTYPTLGKGKSSSKCNFWGIC